MDAVALREMGIGVPQNYSTAVSYYQQASELGELSADQGDSDVQLALQRLGIV